MKTLSSPVVKHLVLVGGGHSHLAVLKQLGMNPLPGLSATLISRDIYTPYSGSLPGHIAGSYDFEQIHIDLRPLAQFAGVRLIQEEITRIDLDGKRVLLRDRPPMEFDLISLNIGSRPDTDQLPGALEHAISIKPIDQFLRRWDEVRRSALERLRQANGKYSLLIVGGGPASVEFAFSAGYRLRKELASESCPSGLAIRLLTADDDILQQHNKKVRRYARAKLQKSGVELLTGHRVSEISAHLVRCVGGGELAADTIVVATGASIPSWPFECGLARSDDGFIEVNAHLQSSSHPFVFAAGDAATIRGEPRPKSGVYAVRQGKPLAENLLRYATGRKLQRYRPQTKALALLSLGDGTAIASRRRLFLKGRWVWQLKHWIDSRFLDKYRDLPEMKPELELSQGLVDEQTEQALRDHAMRCAGCGAKVAGNILSEVLAQLPANTDASVLSTEGAVEDAALIDLNDGRVLVQSVDQLSAFIDDPWLFARIATNHCLSDIYAMGCQPHSALATLGLPFASKRYTRSQLREIMLGCSAVLAAEGCSLIGGHSAEASELSFGLCVNGFADREKLLHKRGMGHGDVLILTKGLGTGTLLAADMRGKAAQSWMEPALKQMLMSNRQGSSLLIEHGATACTDITGFGLAGHLLEMLEPDRVEVELILSDIPALAGALELLGRGITSSLHQDNRRLARDVYNSEAYANDPTFELLFDPQTAGGLLATLPQDSADACLEALHQAGYHQATRIGRVGAVNGDSAGIILC